MTVGGGGGVVFCLGGGGGGRSGIYWVHLIHMSNTWINVIRLVHLAGWPASRLSIVIKTSALDKNFKTNFFRIRHAYGHIWSVAFFIPLRWPWPWLGVIGSAKGKTCTIRFLTHFWSEWNLIGYWSNSSWKLHTVFKWELLSLSSTNFVFQSLSFNKQTNNKAKQKIDKWITLSLVCVRIGA